MTFLPEALIKWGAAIAMFDSHLIAMNLLDSRSTNQQLVAHRFDAWNLYEQRSNHIERNSQQKSSTRIIQSTPLSIQNSMLSPTS